MSINKYIHFQLRKVLVEIFPDNLYLIWEYYYRTGRFLNLLNPKTFTEKIQWLKLYYIKAEYTRMVDKVDAKEYAANLIGEEYIIPTLGVWNSAEEIDWNALPNQFVIKATNDSGGIVVCRNKTTLDIEKAVSKLKKGIGKNYYKYNKEYPYKDVKPRIIAEKYMEDKSSHCTDLVDYKFYCFNGTPLYCQVIQNRSTRETIDFFDMNWNLMPFIGLNKNVIHSDKAVPCPHNYKKMQELVKALITSDMPFVRVDLYEVNGAVFFGEITFFPKSGMGNFYPTEWNRKLGDLIHLPQK